MLSGLFTVTHTFRALCLQMSRAVTPTNMTMRNIPALTPSIMPLRVSAGEKKILDLQLYVSVSLTLFSSNTLVTRCCCLTLRCLISSNTLTVLYCSILSVEHMMFPPYLPR